MKYFKIWQLYTMREEYIDKIYSTPTPTAIQNLIALVENILDPLQEVFPKRIRILSGYRSREYNEAVGGVAHSAHIYGEAVDIIPIYSKPCTRQQAGELFDKIIELGLPFDMLGMENHGAWVHVSYRRFEKNRGLIMPCKIRKPYRKRKTEEKTILTGV